MVVKNIRPPADLIMQRNIADALLFSGQCCYLIPYIRTMLKLHKYHLCNVGKNSSLSRLH